MYLWRHSSIQEQQQARKLVTKTEKPFWFGCIVEAASSTDAFEVITTKVVDATTNKVALGSRTMKVAGLLFAVVYSKGAIFLPVGIIGAFSDSNEHMPEDRQNSDPKLLNRFGFEGDNCDMPDPVVPTRSSSKS